MAAGQGWRNGLIGGAILGAAGLDAYEYVQHKRRKPKLETYAREGIIGAVIGGILGAVVGVASDALQGTFPQIVPEYTGQGTWPELPPAVPERYYQYQPLGTVYDGQQLYGNPPAPNWAGGRIIY